MRNISGELNYFDLFFLNGRNTELPIQNELHSWTTQSYTQVLIDNNSFKKIEFNWNPSLDTESKLPDLLSDTHRGTSVRWPWALPCFTWTLLNNQVHTGDASLGDFQLCTFLVVS